MRRAPALTAYSRGIRHNPLADAMPAPIKLTSAWILLPEQSGVDHDQSGSALLHEDVPDASRDAEATVHRGQTVDVRVREPETAGRVGAQLHEHHAGRREPLLHPGTHLDAQRLRGQPHEGPVEAWIPLVVPVEPAPVVPVRLLGVALGEVPLLVFLPARLVQGDDEHPLARRHGLAITDTPGWRQAACRKAERVRAGQPQFAIQGADVAGPVLAEVLVVQLPQLAEPWSRHRGIIRERIGCGRRPALGGCSNAWDARGPVSVPQIPPTRP